MKKRLFLMVMAAAVVAGLTSCGSGGAGGSVDSSGVFGKLPGIAADYKDKGIDLMKDLVTAKDDEAKKALLAKAGELEKQGDEEFLAALQELKDVEIPVEVKDSVLVNMKGGFKVDLDAKNELGRITLKAAAETSTDQPDRFAKDYFYPSYIRAVLVDADNQPLLALHTNSKVDDPDLLKKAIDIGKAGVPLAITAVVRFELWNSELIGQAKKIVLYHDKSDAIRQIARAAKEKEKAYDEQLKETFKQLEGK